MKTASHLLTKWLMMKSVEGDILIIPKKISRYAPINRVLDKPGFFSYLIEDFGQDAYILTYETQDAYQAKSKMLLTKMRHHQGMMLLMDMTEHDYIHVYSMIEKHMITRHEDKLKLVS